MSEELTLSVWDRLRDDEPTKKSATILTSASIEDYRELVRRDVEYLFNSRREFPHEEADYPLASKSSIAYGLKDLSSYDLNKEEDRLELTRSIRNCLDRYETRLFQINVKLIANDEANRELLKQRLPFKIEGMLKVDPAPIEIAFDTELEINSDSYQVSEGRFA